MKGETSFFILKNVKLTKNNTFNDVFCNKICLYYRFLPIV